MNTELFKHYTEIAKRYQITNLDSFVTSARRYECKLNHLYTLVCDSEKLSVWAESQAEKVSESAKRNLSKYCKYHKLFLNDLHINADPRGYSLKLDINNTKVSRGFYNQVVRDWGGYFILAPESK